MTVDVDGLLDDVATAVGLDDFGDVSFRDGLDPLWYSGFHEAELTEIGVLAFDGHIRSCLANRLRVIEWHKQHPELAATQVEAPLILVGMPRSGTTALSHLLAADPDNRSLRAWELDQSTPPPTTASYDTDPRFEAARASPNPVYVLNPAVKAIHYDGPEDPVECIWLYGQHFQSVIYSTMFNVPTYDEWLLGSDWRAATDYHRKVLQVLQSECPGRWNLKATQYGLLLDDLVATYPDARLVVTHRDPVTSAASTFSLLRSATSTFTDADFTETIATRTLELLTAIVDRALDARDRIGDDAFFDVAYTEFVRDPVAVVAGVYDRFGIEWTDDTERRVRSFQAARPQHRYGTHVYSLADMGVRRDELRERFARYSERYDVPSDDA